MSVQPRLNRLFGPDGRCFDVAIDHGFFNQWRFLTGIEDIQQAISTIVEAAPDAIQLSPGQARVLQAIPGPKPALVLRTDAANVYGKELPRTLFSQLIGEAVQQGVMLDAACVVVNLLHIVDQPELYHRCVANICELKPQCERMGMPLMVEPLVFKGGGEGGYSSDLTLEKIVPLVRQAVELGADIIKADPTDDVSDYHQVIEAAGDIPVLVRGGGRVSDEAILQRTYDLMQQGAKGIVYGRNVIQHKSPNQMTRALMAVVHDGAMPDEALAYFT